MEETGVLPKAGWLKGPERWARTFLSIRAKSLKPLQERGGGENLYFRALAGL